MKSITWNILALVAGGFLHIKAGLNARLGKVARDAVYASSISF